MTCTIEFGNSHYEKAPGWWWWRLILVRYTIESDNFNYETKRSAIRAARHAAKLFGVTVDSVFECGGDDDD